MGNIYNTDNHKHYQCIFIKKYINRSKWMEEANINKTIIKDLEFCNHPISRIPLLRTHQSGSYAIKQLFESLSICQSVSTYNQLVGGARVLDLRLGYYDITYHDISNNSKLVTKRVAASGHGPHAGQRLSIIWEDVIRFLNQNKEEVIIIEIQKANGFSFFNNRNYTPSKSEISLFYKDIFKYFENKLLTSTDFNKLYDLNSYTKSNAHNEINIANISYNQIRKVNKNIILFVNNTDVIEYRYKSLNEAEKEGVFYFESYSKGGWANTHFVNKTLTNSEKYIKYFDTKEYAENNLCFITYTLQLTLQPSSILFNSIYSLHERLFAFDCNNYKIINKVIDWIILRLSKDELNILGIDFSFSYPALIQYITFYNFNKNILLKDNFYKNFNYDGFIFRIGCVYNNKNAGYILNYNNNFLYKHNYNKNNRDYIATNFIKLSIKNINEIYYNYYKIRLLKEGKNLTDNLYYFEKCLYGESSNSNLQYNLCYSINLNKFKLIKSDSKYDDFFLFTFKLIIEDSIRYINPLNFDLIDKNLMLVY